MENQNNYSAPPYPYNPAYGYAATGPTPSNQYPPPNPYPPPNLSGPPAYPPPASGPYPYPPYPYYQTPYAPPPTGHLNYPYPSVPESSLPPPAPHHAPDYSSHPYPYHGYPAPSSSPPPHPSSSPPPQPNFETYGSFRYGSYHYLHHQTSGKLQPPDDHQSETPPRAGSDHSSHHHHHHHHHHNQDSASPAGDSAHSVYSDESSHSRPPLYPPIDDHLANMHLSEIQTRPPSAPASPPAPAAATGGPQKFHSGPLPVTTNGSGGKQGHHHRLSWWETSSTGKMESSRPSTSSPVQYDSSMQLVPVSPKTSLKVLLLHGNLDICIFEAKNLPNMDMFHKTIGDMFNKLPGNVSSKIEGQLNRKITSDPYVSIIIAGATFARTYVISNDENPVWMQTFTVPVAHNAAEVNFVVKDNDIVGSQYIGTVSIPVEQIHGGEEIKGFFPILNANGKPCKVGAVLSLAIKYTPMEQLSIYYNGIGAGPDYIGVPQPTASNTSAPSPASPQATSPENSPATTAGTPQGSPPTPRPSPRTANWR